MFNTLTSTLAAIGLLTLGLQADQHYTLTGYCDAVVIPAGQTAHIVSASNDLVLQIEKTGRRPVQFQFEQSNNCGTWGNIQTSSHSRPTLPAPSSHSPVPIAGPAKLSLRTTGILTLKVIQPEVRRRTTTSSSYGPRRYAKN
ncbi:MAG: hypothetical protein AAGC74_03905 [Verrucomicrobiota bacterium]